ncbi:MAG: NlpC/P60 family protein [Eggerthellaceae bacterium]
MAEKVRALNAKTVLSAFFAVILAVGLAIPTSSAFADPADSKQAEANAALAQLNAYQAELDTASINYQAALQEQMDAEAKVAEAQTQIEEKTTEIEQCQKQLGERARDMYRSGDTSFLDVILGASSFEQFATTWTILEDLNQNDAELVQETKTAREELEAAKTQAEEQAKVASDKAAEAKAVADAADAKAAEMQSVYDSLSAEAAALVEQQRAAEEQAQTDAAVDRIENGNAGNIDNGNNSNNNNSNNSNNNNNNNNSSSNNDKDQTVTGNVVVDRAYAQLGKPYKWGASGPSSFDCSGLVGYCLTGNYGNHWCTTGTIMGWTKVTNPRPGDICIRNGHTGVYIGGGQMIHAPHTGAVVKIAPVPGNMWYVRY